MEMIDVVNDNDEIIGVASKKDIYDKLLTHRISHVLIFDDEGRMLLQLRGNVKFPYHWSTSVGGHIKSGETCEDAALREMKEEAGVDVSLEFLFKDTFVHDYGIKKFLYIYKAVHDGPFICGEDVEKLEFFTLDEIREMIKNGEKFHPELLFLLKKHFNITSSF
jgi:isopentenyldiphosphate isomerase